MAIARLEQIQTQNIPMALFCYWILMWVPITISAGLMAAWNLAAGGEIDIVRCIIFMVVLRQVNVFTLSTLFHRSYSHRQFQYHPILEHPMRVWNWVWVGTGGRAWSILHRWHHAASDTDEDPHSPTKTGGSIWNITQQTFKSYQECLHNPEQYRRYEYKLPDDRFEHFVRYLESKGIWGLAIVRMPLIFAIMTPFIGLPAAICALPGIMASVWFSTVIIVNGLCHIIGYQVMDSGDTSTNLFPIDLFGWGEALHHNHHYQQGQANYAIASFEWDPGFWTLWCLSKVGLVRNLRA
jgi:stearoyl-CoA desaturase (delta-9 desaturase)